MTSKAVRVHFCFEKETSQNVNYITVQKGERFVIPVIAEDQVNSPVEATVYSNLIRDYKAKYCYWYGLFLLVRMALYLGIATEKSHVSVTIVLAIGLIAASILLLRTFFGNNVYRNQ